MMTDGCINSRISEKVQVKGMTTLELIVAHKAECERALAEIRDLCEGVDLIAHRGDITSEDV
jgi:hypothetical protein